MQIEANRQTAENWLDPIVRSRVTCHNIKWTESDKFSWIQVGGDIHFNEIPVSGTMPHTHEFLEVLLINEGAVEHRVNGGVQRLTAGDICFLRPDDEHSFGPDKEFDNVEIVMFDFDLELALSLSVYLDGDEFLHRMTEPVLPACFSLESGETGLLYNRLLRLNTQSINNASVRKINTSIFIAELYTRYFIDDLDLLKESAVPEWLENLCTVMRRPENFLGGLTRMQELAGCTPGNLCKVFRKYLRKTPTDFINELRIGHAARRLVDSDSKILEIAYDTNFQSLSRFYNLFKKAYSVSPAEYRKLHRSGRRI
ncbi:MAG: AraC family transcriptional regulator [Lentisphaerae bacterium]|nr:AraC family transcriptional regulator [Lentisphaerota bacterium]